MKRLFEYKKFNSLSEQELLEMANIDQESTGIKNVVIWAGPNPGYHWKRIKVSNIPNKFDGDCFTLTIPDFEIIGRVNTKLINKKVLEQIKEFVNINYQLICDYSDYKISTKNFINSLKSI